MISASEIDGVTSYRKCIEDACQDFAAFLSESDLTQAQMDAAMATISEPIEDDTDLTRRGRSLIQGAGIFADQLIPEGTLAATAFANGHWTVAGRYANHSHIPNVSPRRNVGSIELVALEEIYPNQEITVNYREMKQSMEAEVQTSVST